MVRRHAIVNVHVAAVSLAPLLACVAPAPAFAQHAPITLPAMELGRALQAIQTQSGTQVEVDPDAVRHLTSAPVRNARTAADAVQQATRGKAVEVTVRSDGSILVENGIVVVARRDEAETSILVRGDTSSTRTGESLRDQPRNTQVISSKLLAEQQAQSLPDALRNAGGVTVNSATVQGGVGYTVRGFTSGGAVNGAPTPSTSLFAAGSTQSVANVERLEVLKGPDAILLGGDSLGGTVNIVTKKPSADERLYVSTEAGSFGAGRITLDANRAITSDQRVSARIIATAADSDRNFGGYRGNEDYLLAPSIRFKNAQTDITASLTATNQIFGMIPYTLYDTTAKRPIAIPRGTPFVGDKDQYSQITSTIYDIQAKQHFGNWLTLAAHYQHQDSSLLLRQYSPFALLGPNRLLLSRTGVSQQSNNDVVDGYVRAAFTTGAFEHKIVVGGMYSSFDVTQDDAVSNGGFLLYNYVTKSPALPVRPAAYRFNNAGVGTQTSFYGQYLLKFWRLALMASARRTSSDFSDTTIDRPTVSYRSAGQTTPSYGAVFTVTGNLSLYGTLAYGFIPSFSLDANNALLPDTETRNAEAGIKWDLFNKRVLINASYFDLYQSNLKDADRSRPGAFVNLPGQTAKGIDLGIQGEPLRGWMISGNFTRTNYALSVPGTFTAGTTVTLQPRDQYSLYTSYRHKVAEQVSAGAGIGTYGRSSIAIDARNLNRLEGANQVDLNAFLTVGKVDLNFGIRNLFDRVNYNPTSTTVYVPIGEPRTWRLTAGYRFR